MQPNPLLPSIPDMLLIGGVVLAAMVLIGVGVTVWLTRRSRRNASRPEDAAE